MTVVFSDVKLLSDMLGSIKNLDDYKKVERVCAYVHIKMCVCVPLSFALFNLASLPSLLSVCLVSLSPHLSIFPYTWCGHA